MLVRLALRVANLIQDKISSFLVLQVMLIVLKLKCGLARHACVNLTDKWVELQQGVLSVVGMC